VVEIVNFTVNLTPVAPPAKRPTTGMKVAPWVVFGYRFHRLAFAGERVMDGYTGPTGSFLARASLKSEPGMTARAARKQLSTR
jgi:hypothetical protein